MEEFKPYILESGWWYCNCELDCNCGDKKKPHKIHQPEHHKCRFCGTWKPEE